MASDFFSGDRFFALGADKHNFVAHFDVVIAAIDHELVHRDHADNPALLATDENLAANESEPSRNTIGVANRNCRNSGIGVETVSQSVGNPFTGFDSFHRRNFGAQRKRGLEVWGARKPWCRSDAIDRNADSY
jgi:hypothetical protein